MDTHAAHIQSAPTFITDAVEHHASQRAKRGRRTGTGAQCMPCGQHVSMRSAPCCWASPSSTRLGDHQAQSNDSFPMGQRPFYCKGPQLTLWVIAEP